MNNFEIKNLSDLQPAESLTILLYGQFGSGKTQFIGSAGSRTLIINIGSGIDTLHGKTFKDKNPNVDPLIITINETLDENGQFDTAEAFDAVTDAIDFALKNHHDKFDTIAIDDITALRGFAMNKGLELNQKTKKSQTNAQRKDYGATLPAVQDYGTEMSLIEWFIKTYTNLCKREKKHLIMTAHERQQFKKADKIGEQPSLFKIRPGFTGQTFPDDMCAHFDFVWHAEIAGGGGQIVYRVRTVGDEVISARTRYGGIFDLLEKDLSFSKVLSKIQTYTLSQKPVPKIVAAVVK